MKRISKLLFRNRAEDHHEIEYFDGIPESQLISDLSKWIRVQAYFEEEEKNFKMAMKMYENAMSEENKALYSSLYKRFGYRYVKPADRKKYLEELKKNLMKKSSKIKGIMP